MKLELKPDDLLLCTSETDLAIRIRLKKLLQPHPSSSGLRPNSRISQARHNRDVVIIPSLL
uniref:Uncharacterized protein n=1 Tax=Romanomermis culicivorax TaxID=13658 RepID=A0A915JEE2_ROMCU